LKSDNKDIIFLGESDIVNVKIVNVKEFVYVLSKRADGSSQEGKLILYFSGHGCNIKNQHYLAFSDDIVNTKDLKGFLRK